MRKREKEFSPDDPAVRSRELLFVYGTLLRNLSHPMHQVLTSYANFVRAATFQGRLYDLGSYPGAVPSKKASDKVRGEVYSIQDPERIFRLIDEYEGKEFRCVRVLISLENGKEVCSWIYLYKGPTNGRKVIPSGDYKRYHKTHP